MFPIRNHSDAPVPLPAGFSLVEMMAAMSISMVVIAALLSSYTFLGRNLVRDSNQQQLEVQSRKMLQVFGQDVRMAANIPSFSANEVTLRLPSGSGTSFFDVAYAFSASAGTYQVPLLRADGTTANYAYTAPTAGTLTRIDGTNGAVTLLTGASNFSFRYLDKLGLSVDPTPPTYPLRVKQIEVSGFTITAGTASIGTQSQYTGASARLVLRNKHLVN
jgi:Tfp pilus assembly protein PilW